MRKGGLVCTLGWVTFIGGFLAPAIVGVFMIMGGVILVMIGHNNTYEQGYREGYGDGKGWTKREDREPGYKK